MIDRWKSQKGLCYWCHRKMHRKSSKKSKKRLLLRTRDHLIPRSEGGMGGNNIVMACLGCNRDKDNLNEQEYRIIFILRKTKKLKGDESTLDNRKATGILEV